MNVENKRRKIFIVEDNQLNMKLFNDILSANDFEVLFTLDGFEAFDMIKESMPDAILMDIQLHGISGFDIIREIKSDNDLKEIPIIAVTAFVMKDDKQKILNSGCAAYVSKPISIKPFIEIVNKFANKEILN
jgi:two-component system cell cycle response regulator DivK